MIKYSQNSLKQSFTYYSLFCVWWFPTATTEPLPTKKSKSRVSPAAFNLGSSETKHPFLFLRLLSCLSIYSTIPKDSVITLLRLALGMNSKEKAGGTACTKTHTLHTRNHSFLDKNIKINSML